MRTKIFISSVVILGTLSILSSCTKGVAETDAAITAISAESDLKSATLAAEACLLTGTVITPSPVCTVTGTATEAEKAGILFMREEEKLARDLYSYFFLKYNLPVFNNISKSENIHVAAVQRLMTGLSIADNSSNNPGEYINADLKALYVKLKTMGDLSLIDALKVGVLVEQTDIADLQKHLSVVDNLSINTVYTNLTKASEAHLKSFSWNLKVKGVVYP